MRKISTESIDMGSVGDNKLGTSNAGELVTTVLAMKPDGMDMQELRQCLRVLDAVKAAEGKAHIFLDDADWSYLVQRLDVHRWRIPSHGFEKFDGMVRTAEKFDPNEVEEKPAE